MISSSFDVRSRLVRPFERFAFAGITLVLCGCEIPSGPATNRPVFEQVSAGGSHACALSADGVAYCWGGDHHSTPLPARVNGDARFRSLSSSLWGGNGYGHSYGSGAASVLWIPVWALASDGSLWTWGQSAWDADGSPVPMAAPAFTAMVAGGRGGLVPNGRLNGGAGPGILHVTCGLTHLGKIHCYGDNQHGQLGSGSTSSVAYAFAEVAGEHAFASLPTGSLSSDHVCALTAERQVYCWGGNYAGQLGATTSERCVVSTIEPPVRDVSCSRTPVLAAQGRTFVEIAVGAGFTCALEDGGTLYCWGSNASGKLGRGTAADRGEPAPVSGGRSFVHVVTSYQHACAVDDAGAAYCWGHNAQGQLGNGTTEGSSVPVAVAGDHRFRSLALGQGFTCGVTDGGAVLCWGSGYEGQLGTGTSEASLVPIPIHDVD